MSDAEKNDERPGEQEEPRAKRGSARGCWMGIILLMLLPVVVMMVMEGFDEAREQPPLSVTLDAELLLESDADSFTGVVIWGPRLHEEEGPETWSSVGKITIDGNTAWVHRIYREHPEGEGEKLLFQAAVATDEEPLGVLISSEVPFELSVTSFDGNVRLDGQPLDKAPTLRVFDPGTYEFEFENHRRTDE